MEGFDTAAEKSERERGEGGRREERAGRQLEKEAATAAAGDKMGDEEGEISSGSSTPGPASETHTVVTPRCYMDREGGGGAGVGETQKSR